MKQVTGIGGIFFKAKDAPALQAWYKRHLGIDVQEWGGAAFTWSDAQGQPSAGTTIWSIGPTEGDNFAPSKAFFMVNYRVEDLHGIVKVLREEGCEVLDRVDESEYGKFAWVIDPEGKQGRIVATAVRAMNLRQLHAQCARPNHALQPTYLRHAQGQTRKSRVLGEGADGDSRSSL